MNNSYTALYRLSAWPVSEAGFLYAHEKEAECLRSRDRSPNGLDWGSPFHVQGATIIFTWSSDLAKLSSCTGVSEARLDLFARKQYAYDSIPPTSGALKEHVKRAAFQAGHIWNQSTVCNPQLPSPGDWGWTKVDGTWVPHWTEASWQLSPNRVKN